MDEAVILPVDGNLDLHTFRPSEAADLVEDYLVECRAIGVLLVRVIHGKGTGQLREKVHSRLRKLSWVESIEWPADTENWGATVVRLFPVNA
ncbi:MAG: Smr/MutS family protein [Candidatus Riflebacteria bacterium]|nr:Smr/MutS family protein [Candidatus Riflebacteria bacterium]